jgi:hypothetical protein
MAELSEAEAFVLRGLRHWILGLQRRDPRHWSRVWNDFAVALGAADARGLLTALTGLVHGLCGHARRAVVHHRPCCGAVSPDEACLLALIADCQRGDGHAAASRAAWLVQSEGIAALAEAAGDMAAILAARGYRLDPAPPPAGRERVSLADMAVAGTKH